jgi:hypothetical protein
VLLHLLGSRLVGLAQALDEHDVGGQQHLVLGVRMDDVGRGDTGGREDGQTEKRADTRVHNELLL